MNAQLQPSPHAPDDTHSDVRWQAAIDTCAASIVQADEVGEMVGLLADGYLMDAVRAALNGRALLYGERTALQNLYATCRVTHECVAAEYERRDEA